MAFARYIVLIFLSLVPSLAYGNPPLPPFDKGGIGGLHGGEVVKEGEKAPTFVLMDEHGRMVNMEDILTRPTVIYFTHNACHYCTQIIAYLKRAEEKFGADQIQIITINVMAKDPRLIKAYKEALEFSFPMFAGNRSDLLRAYEINYVPLLVFIDSKKIVRKVVGHYIHEPELHKNISVIIGK